MKTEIKKEDMTKHYSHINVMLDIRIEPPFPPFYESKVCGKPVIVIFVDTRAS